MRVLLVENHAFTLTTLTAALSGWNLDVRGCSAAREALREVADFVPEVAVLDLDLGTGPSGLDLAIELRRRFPNVGIVLLTSYRDARLHSSGIRPLPQGGIYLCKADLSDFHVLIDAIHAVRHAPLVTRRLAFGPQGASAVLTDSLVEILVAIATGSTTAQIAATRGVSASAVEKSIARICEQLDIAKDPNLNQRVQLSRMYNHLRELDGA